MKKIEIQRKDEQEIEWQSIQDTTGEWSDTIEEFEELSVDSEEQRRQEAMLEAVSYEETEFEDVGFGNATFQGNNEEEVPPGKPFPVWLLPIAALLICIPLGILAWQKDYKTQSGTQPTQSLLASAENQEQTDVAKQESMATSEAEAVRKTEEKKETATAKTDASDAADSSLADKTQTTQEASQPGEDTTVSGGDAYVSGDASMPFQQNNDIVSAVDSTNLRMLPTTEGGGVIIAQLKRGQNIRRTGMNEETGWSRVSYYGQVLYAVTQYLTIEEADAALLDEQVQEEPVKPLDISTIAFTECDDYVQAVERVNLRTEPSTARGSQSVRVQIGTEEVLHRTGYTTDGAWSRIEYQGEILYVINNYIAVAAQPQP